MSYCRQEGKDKIVFATKEDHQIPSTVTLPEPDPSPGLILPDGKINWNCPCLGNLASGPCCVEFREAFSCFHYSTSESKGGECYEKFAAMQSCMSKYPTLYNKGISDNNDEEGEDDKIPLLGATKDTLLKEASSVIEQGETSTSNTKEPSSVENTAVGAEQKS